MNDSDKTLLIIDSHALIYRAYYAFPPTLTTSGGEPVNAVFGYASLVLDVLLKFLPSHVVAVMDSKGPVSRQTDYSFYKANRASADDLMVTQFPRIEEFLKNFNIPVLKIDGVEADDIIATVDHNYSGKWAKTIVVTGDQDIFQIVDEDTFVYLAGRKFSESKLYDEGMVVEKLGIKPVQVPDYKAIAGDASDNIPGVRGIGPKGAIELIEEFESIENLYTKIDQVKDKYKQKLIENHELAMMSKDLALAHKDIPIVFDIESAQFDDLDLAPVEKFFEELQFKSLITKLSKFHTAFKVKENTKKIKDQVVDLFNDSSEEIQKNLWNGTPINVQNELYILADFENLDQSPVHWQLERIFFSIDSSEVVQVVDKNLIAKFVEMIKEIKVITYDSKKLLHSLKNLNLTVKEKNIFDIGIACIVTSGGKCTYSLNSIFHFLGEEYQGNLERNLLSLKGAYKNYLEKCEDDGSFKEVIELEHKILPIVCAMEASGIMFDEVLFTRLLEKFEGEKATIRDEIYKLAGHEFNINSPKQVGEVLFVEKSLPGARKTKSGSFSTDERSLSYLIGVDPIIEKVLEYREVDKIISTYLKAIPEYAESDSKRIHGIFDQIGAVSGRFSSKNPNLQNIPKSLVRGENLRDAFIAPEGKMLVSFDYSQQELRILAALAGEEEMINSFNTESDVHKLTASEIFEVEIDKVTKEQRDQGKTINFSIIYGISAFGLSERMKIPRDMATLFIDKYFEKYKKVKEFLAGVIKQATIDGYTETVLKRRRYNEMIKSNNRNFKSAAERELFNFIIQGSAADIMKLAMINFSDILSEYNAKLLLQVHDEFVFEIEAKNKDDKNLAEFVSKVYDEMCNAYDIGVKYKVEVGVGTKWGSLNKIDNLQ
jgi:DNA polymerase-1